MILSFSSAYFDTSLSVVPYSGDRCVIQSSFLSNVDHGYTWPEPIVCKVGSVYVSAFGESAVPSDVLAVPADLHDSWDLDENTSVLITKKRAAEFLRMMDLVDP